MESEKGVVAPWDILPINVNLQVPEWLHHFMITGMIFSLSLTLFTAIFQLAHPKSQ